MSSARWQSTFELLICGFSERFFEVVSTNHSLTPLPLHCFSILQPRCPSALEQLLSSCSLESNEAQFDSLNKDSKSSSKAIKELKVQQRV